MDTAQCYFYTSMHIRDLYTHTYIRTEGDRKVSVTRRCLEGNWQSEIHYRMGFLPPWGSLQQCHALPPGMSHQGKLGLYPNLSWFWFPGHFSFYLQKQSYECLTIGVGIILNIHGVGGGERKVLVAEQPGEKRGQFTDWWRSLLSMYLKNKKRAPIL